MQEGFLRTDEKKEFEKFSQALDNAIVSKYHGVLQEVKVHILLNISLNYKDYQKYVPSRCKYLSCNVMKYIKLGKLMKLNKNPHKKITLIFILF